MQQANNGIKLLVFPVIRWEFGHIFFRHGKYQVQSNMQQDREEESHKSPLPEIVEMTCAICRVLHSAKLLLSVFLSLPSARCTQQSHCLR